MSYNKELALHILRQIEKAILLIQSRTSEIHSASDFLSSPQRVEKLDAVCMQFITIGESLKGLEKVTMTFFQKSLGKKSWVCVILLHIITLMLMLK